MIKGIFYISLFISLFLGDYLFTEEASIYAKYPTEVSAGAEFTIEITIEKGNLSQFGRFRQQLPDGFTATSDSKLFDFDDQTIKFLWVSLPVGNTFTFSYKIQIPETYAGKFQITGEFAYILDNERKTATLNPQDITVQPSGVPVASGTNFTSSGDQLAPPKDNIYCYRQIFNEHNGGIVKLLLHKENLNNMAKLVEQVPAGFNIEVIEDGNSIFTFDNNTAKFMWMNLPGDDEFVVSYRVIPSSNVSMKDFNPNGELSYSVNNLTQTVPIINKDFEQQKQEPVITEAAIEPIVQEIYSNAEQKASNVQYKIQIAASHKMVNTKKYFRKYKIDDLVSVDLHDGWHKYMIKKFYEYKDAKVYRDKVWTVTPVDDAFIAAYNNGERITVQEALMITNQKWYK